ncbi:CyP450 monooxygenase [Earliella scabrosa]|nr:CyP450 monooxygenase [Earliella scabrosa]
MSSFPGLPHPSPLAVVGVILLAFTVFYRYRLWRAQHHSSPPGPPPLPIIGNLLDVPKSMSAKEYDVLSKTYGDVVHLSVFGQHIVLLGSLEAAVELLDKRSSNYSDKPTSAMADLIDLGWNVALLGNGERWRKQRKQFHRFLGGTAITQYHPLLEKQTRRLLRMLLMEPAAFSEHVRFILGATITKIAYGHDVHDPDNECLALAEAGNDIFLEAFVPGRYLVESFPILKYIPAWFPGAGFRKQAAAWRETYVQVRSKPFQATMENLRDGRDTSSMAARMMSDAGEGAGAQEVDEETAKDVAAAVYLGGADTTLTTIRLFFLAMAKFPDVQRTAQEELDRVIGPGRLPQFSDRSSLPYIEAIVKECLRWNPILPLALPRTTFSDDEYKGYFIPKGSVVMANSWALSRDPRHYPDPERFRPERFLKDGVLNPDVLDPKAFAFGYGRRICPGRAMGESSVFITVAAVLHMFSIEPPLDEHGVPSALDVKFGEGILSAAEPFSCRIIVRSPAARGLIVSDDD